MAPFRASRSTRSGRPGGQTDHDVFDGLPVRQWKLQETTIQPPTAEVQNAFGLPQVVPQETAPGKPFDKWSVERPMPKGAELYAPWCQQILRAGRAGKIAKKKDLATLAREREEREREAEEGSAKDVSQKVFTAKKWLQIPRHMEEPEREYLAKRRKGLTSAFALTAEGTVINIAPVEQAPVVEERRRNVPPRRKPKKGFQKKKKMSDGAGLGVSASAEALAAQKEAAAQAAVHNDGDTPMQDAGDDEDGEEDEEDGEEGEDDDGEGEAEEEEEGDTEVNAKVEAKDSEVASVEPAAGADTDGNSAAPKEEEAAASNAQQLAETEPSPPAQGDETKPEPPKEAESTLAADASKPPVEEISAASPAEATKEAEVDTLADQLPPPQAVAAAPAMKEQSGPAEDAPAPEVKSEAAETPAVPDAPGSGSEQPLDAVVGVDVGVDVAEDVAEAQDTVMADAKSLVEDEVTAAPTTEQPPAELAAEKTPPVEEAQETDQA